MTFKLLGARVAIELIKEEYISAGGIIIPAGVSMNFLPARGKVAAVGSGMRDENTSNIIPFEVKADDIVLFDKSQATEIRIEGKVLVLVEERDIIAIIN